MASTFFGLTIASSGLSAYQIALNTTANNISNVQTEGYTKQVANRTAGDALRAYAKYGSMGTGVTTESITQIRNEYYDVKYWYNQQSVGLYETKLNYLQQIENYFIDDGDEVKGFSTILNTMFNDLDSMKNSSGTTETRNQFVNSAKDLCTYFNSVYQGLKDIQSTVNDEIKNTVENINSIGTKIAQLNKQINIIEINGGYANELRDERALLVDELSTLVPTEVSEVPVVNTNDPDNPTGANYYTVTIGGQTLVDTYDNYKLVCVARDENSRVNQTDIDGLYDIEWADTGNTFAGGADYMSGTLKGLFDIRDGNNGDNFRGSVTGITDNTITLTGSNISTVESLNIPETGRLYINGRYYEYSGFTYTTKADSAEIESYTFTMADTQTRLTSSEASRINGKTAQIGTSVDTMGVPYYQAQMNEFVRSFAEAFNDIELQGMDLYKNEVTDSFFTGTLIDGSNINTGYSLSKQFEDGTLTGAYTGSSSDASYYKITAENFCIADVFDDPKRFGTTADTTSDTVDAYELVEEMAKLKSDPTKAIFRGCTADGFLKCIISDISLDTQESKIFYQNYSNIADNITTQRMSTSGVDEDEEGLDLVKFQNAYNLSSKMVSVMAEIYDRLILETGV
jgi:flagellar hook-associated protein 1 FlgK